MFLRMKTTGKGGKLKSKKTTTEMYQVFPCSWEFFLAAPGLAQLENVLVLLVRNDRFERQRRVLTPSC